MASKPSQRIHAYYCGPFLGPVYTLVIVDAFLKWSDVFFTMHAITGFTLKALRKTFNKEGDPADVVTDNDRQFSTKSETDWYSIYVHGSTPSTFEWTSRKLC